MNILFNHFAAEFDYSLGSLITILIALIILWIIISLPVYIAAKVVTGGKASLFAAMGATVLGPIIYALTMFLSTIFLGSIIGVPAIPLSILIAFIAWLAIYKSAFSTGWFGAFAIALLAAIIFIITSILIASIIGSTAPNRFFDFPIF